MDWVLGIGVDMWDMYVRSVRRCGLEGSIGRYMYSLPYSVDADTWVDLGLEGM